MDAADVDANQPPLACTVNAGADPGSFRVTLPSAREIPVFIRYPVGATGARPVVVFSHGGSPGQVPGQQSVCWARSLARAGYVVIQSAHPFLDGCNPEPDPGEVGCTPEQVQERNALCAAYGITDATECEDMNYSEITRPHDLRAVLDDLDCIEASLQQVSGSTMTFDRAAIGVMGWSAGTWGTLGLAGARRAPSTATAGFTLRDPRPRAFVAASPSGPGMDTYYCRPDVPTCCVGDPDVTACADGTWETMSSWSEIDRPVMMLTGGGDCTENGSGRVRMRAFDALGSSRKALVFLRTPSCMPGRFGTPTCADDGCITRHETFNLWGTRTCDADGVIRPEDGSADADLAFRHARLLQSAGLAFLDATVRGRAEAMSYLASDRLEVLGEMQIDWPGDPSMLGACSATSLEDCVYQPAETFPVAESQNPADVASYYHVRTSSY